MVETFLFIFILFVLNSKPLKQKKLSKNQIIKEKCNIVLFISTILINSTTQQLGVI